MSGLSALGILKCENTGSDLDDVTRSVNMRRLGTENSRIRRFMMENSLEFTRKIISKNRGVELAQKMEKIKANCIWENWSERSMKHHR